MSFIRKKLLFPINLNTTKRRFYHIFFSVFFAFFFLNIFEPYGLYSNAASPKDVFFELTLAALVAFVVLLFSQFLLRDIFRLKQMNLLKIICWFLLEAIMVGSAWYALDLIDSDFKNSGWNYWLENFWGYIFIIVIPYFAYVFFSHTRDRLKQVELNKQSIDFVANEKTNVQLSFADENGMVRLKLDPNNLLYLQSSDNYVELFYLDNQKIAKFLLRNSMKNVEEQLNTTEIVRCHRSYMINIKNVITAKKIPSGLHLSLKQVSDKSIPVSKSYSSEISKLLDM